MFQITPPGDLNIFMTDFRKMEVCCVADGEDVGVDVVVSQSRRRSSRKRRSHEAWKRTLEMSVRTSRANGDSIVVPVKIKGGQPSHKCGIKACTNVVIVCHFVQSADTNT